MVNICCIGAGSEGSSTMSVLALKCPEARVFIIETFNQNLIEQWNRGENVTTEPELKDMLAQCMGRNLFFSNHNVECIQEADIIFLSPAGNSLFSCNTEDIYTLAARSVASIALSEKIVVAPESSKVIERILRDHITLSQPEFFEKGSIVHDILNPELVVIGSHSTPKGRAAAGMLKSIYANWIPEDRIVLTDYYAADIIKLAVSNFLAQRICSTNFIALLCQIARGDMTEVCSVLGQDPRMGLELMKPSVGFGGSLFHRDILKLVDACRICDLNASHYWRDVLVGNMSFINRFADVVYIATRRTPKIAVFGFACNNHSNETINSPALQVCTRLLEKNSILRIYDARLMPEKIAANFQGKEGVKVLCDPYEAAEGCGSICILTASEGFKNLDYKRLYSKMVKPARLFDGYNILDHKEMKAIGFYVTAIGK